MCAMQFQTIGNFKFFDKSTISFEYTSSIYFHCALNVVIAIGFPIAFTKNQKPDKNIQ